MQRFQWDQLSYQVKDENSGQEMTIDMRFDENNFLIMAQRYKELASTPADAGKSTDVPYDLAGYLTEIDTGRIDADYMNSRFVKYMKLLKQEGTPGDLIEEAKAELHKTFATLSQEEQKYANIFLHDIERGDVTPEEGKTLRDYITEYNNRLFQLFSEKIISYFSDKSCLMSELCQHCQYVAWCTTRICLK